MVEIASVRELKFKKEIIKIEFTYIAEYNKQRPYFNNLDYDTTEGVSDDIMDYLGKHINDFLEGEYPDFTKNSEHCFKQNNILNDLKFIYASNVLQNVCYKFFL